MRSRKVSIATVIQPPANLLRCKVCAQHTDIRCSGCHRGLCRLHTASASCRWDNYCMECLTAQYAVRQGGTRA
jgi:hypothetical protein